MDSKNTYADLLLDRGMAHLVYYVSDAREVIHPYALKEYPLLSDEFLSFLETHRPMIPKKVPIVLEITGKKLSEEERSLIDETIWTHNCLNMTYADNAAKACLKHSLLYLVFSLASAILLLLGRNATNEVAINLIYLPFWFFAYRLVTYLVIDCIPLLEDRNWYRRLASLKLIIPEDGKSVFEDLDPEKTAEELKKYEVLTSKEVSKNKLLDEFLMLDGAPALACRVSNIRDLIAIPELKGRELLSDSMSACIEQVVPFLKPDKKVTLTLTGAAFTPEEQQSICRALRNHFALRCAEEDKNDTTNKKMILFFLLSILFSALLLLLWGNSVGTAGHEFLLVLLSFFGDYTMEFILISHRSFSRSKRNWKALMETEVLFAPDETK